MDEVFHHSNNNKKNPGRSRNAYLDWAHLFSVFLDICRFVMWEVCHWLGAKPRIGKVSPSISTTTPNSHFPVKSRQLGVTAGFVHIFWKKLRFWSPWWEYGSPFLCPTVSLVLSTMPYSGRCSINICWKKRKDIMRGIVLIMTKCDSVLVLWPFLYVE